MLKGARQRKTGERTHPTKKSLSFFSFYNSEVI